MKLVNPRSRLVKQKEAPSCASIFHMCLLEGKIIFIIFGKSWKRTLWQQLHFVKHI